MIEDVLRFYSDILVAPSQIYFLHNSQNTHTLKTKENSVRLSEIKLFLEANK